MSDLQILIADMLCVIFWCWSTYNLPKIYGLIKVQNILINITPFLYNGSLIATLWFINSKEVKSTEILLLCSIVF